jgi:ATP-binding cassette, subfamily C (CFTR/MRP), member 1
MQVSTIAWAKAILANFPVRHLPLADNITVVDASGRIFEQGSFEYLQSKDGFVSKVFLQPEILEQGRSRRDNIELKPLATPRILQGPTENDVVERTRRIGDFSVYKYYLTAIGWKLCSTVVAVAIIYMVAHKFPRRLKLLALICSVLTHSLALWLTWYSNGTVKSLVLFSTIYAASAVVALVSSAGMLW